MKAPTAVMALAFAQAILPPLRSSQIARLALFSLHMIFISGDKNEVVIVHGLTKPNAFCS
jgi:hypothetical protein